MEWVASKWQTRESLDVDNFDLCPVTIELMVSPFYEGTRYAVRRDPQVLAMDGTWEYEPLPSSRGDAFYERCRFKSFDAAKAAAEKAIAEDSK